jgi:hypothetical protein
VEDDQLRQIRAMVEARQTLSVSGFAKHAIRITLFDAAAWRQMLRDALQDTERPLTADERKSAMRIYPRGHRGGTQNPARQARLARLIRQVGTALIAPDAADARWSTSNLASSAR